MFDYNPYEEPTEAEELASAYVPFQKIRFIYKPEESLRKGTIFPELYKPYKKKKEDCEKYKLNIIF